jgi:uncharacterized protein YbjT (DUF2867 family)
MAEVLVTGGTGTLGRSLVPRLVAAGHGVRTLSRHATGAGDGGVRCLRGDVLTGAGVGVAVDGCDVVVHAASNPRRKVRETELAGAANVAGAARQTGAHLIYVSIVGVERHRYAYYRAKYAAEQVIAASGARWTTLRATQFFDLIDMFLGKGVFIRTRDLRFQPVAVDEVAARLVELVGAAPQGLAAEFGGPQVLSIGELADIRHQVTGARTSLIPLPRLGFLADFDAGRHLAPEHRDGRETWADWLSSRTTPASP